MEGKSLSGTVHAWTVVKILLGIIVAWLLISQYLGVRRVDSARAALLDKFQDQRRSRVIAMIHRQETVSLFGVPVSRADNLGSLMNTRSRSLRLANEMFSW